MTDDLARVLADIDTLLPPGAPTTPSGACEPWEAEAMRWSPVDHNDHPETVRGGTTTTHTARVTLQRTTTDDRGSADAPYAHGRRVGEPDRGSLGLFQQQQPNLWPNTDPRVPPVGGSGVPDRVGVVIEQASRYSGWSESVMRAAIQATADAYQAQLESLRGQAQHTTSNLQHLRNRHQQAQAVINARRHRNTGPQNPAGIDGRPRRHQHPTKAAADNARPATHTEATPVIVAWQAWRGGTQ